ncbi:hypothetical protein HK102_004683, partial [Quaeritorhiza haematococci]
MSSSSSSTAPPEPSPSSSSSSSSLSPSATAANGEASKQDDVSLKRPPPVGIVKEISLTATWKG